MEMSTAPCLWLFFFTHVMRKLFLVRFTTIFLPKAPRAVTLCTQRTVFYLSFQLS